MTESKLQRWHVRIRAIFFGVLCLLVSSTQAITQETRQEVWPEFDAFYQFDQRFRIFLLAAFSSAEEGDFKEGQLGAHIDFGIKPKIRKFLDNEKNQYLSGRIGYRYISSLGAEEDPYKEHRVVSEITPRFFLPLAFVLHDRNRTDFRWIASEFSWRYRNRLTLERQFEIRRFKFIPYITGEAYYDNRYHAWNRHRYGAGVQLPLGKRLALDFYNMRQHDSRSEPTNIYAFGWTVAFYL